jgi:ribosomal protein S18 acetylase RimI-like enzyme
MNDHPRRVSRSPEPDRQQSDAGFDESPGHGGLSRDAIPVRCLRPEDRADVLRIDRKITGKDRSDYYEQKFDEALDESAVRVSLVAESEPRPVGFIMARVDFGGFGQTEPVAVIDTLGVDPDFANQGIGKALLSQLLANLAALRVEKVETQVARENFDLLGFFYHCGFGPSQNLAFRKRID